MESTKEFFNAIGAERLEPTAPAPEAQKPVEAPPPAASPAPKGAPKPAPEKQTAPPGNGKGILSGAFLTSQELSEKLRISRSTILKRVQAKCIPFVRIGTQIRFRLEAVEAWLSGSETPLEAVNIPKIPRKAKPPRESAAEDVAQPPAPAKKPANKRRRRRGSTGKKGKK